MCQDVAVERVDATGGCPCVEGQVIRLSRSKRDCVLLDGLRQHMPVFGDDVEGVSMYMHGVYHRRIRTNQPDMNCLTMLDQNGLGIREALAIDDEPAARHHANEFCILHIGVNSLL